MNQSTSERQTASRAKKKSDGFTRTTLRFDAKTMARLRRLAKRHDTTQANVVTLGLHLAEDEKLLRELKAMAVQRQANARQRWEAP